MFVGKRVACGLLVILSKLIGAGGILNRKMIKSKPKKYWGEDNCEDNGRN